MSRLTFLSYFDYATIVNQTPCLHENDFIGIGQYSTLLEEVYTLSLLS